MRRWRMALTVTGLLVVAACQGNSADSKSTASTSSTGSAGPASTPSSAPSTLSSVPTTVSGTSPQPSEGPSRHSAGPTPSISPATGLPGMPAVTNPHNVYADAGAGMVQAKFAKYPAYAYVPHNKSGDVWVIDQKSYQVVRKCPVGIEIQHVVPSWDMTQLYATDDEGNVIREINPATGQCGATYSVRDPYNMYFTPDGKYAISVAEKYRQLVWYDPKTWTIKDTTDVSQCAGVDHADFSPDGKTAVFTCEFAGAVIVVDIPTHKVLRTISMPQVNTMMGPQDIKLAPDGSVYYIADSDSNGVWVLDAHTDKVKRHIATGEGAHGLYLSRNAKQLYVTNRLEGSVSVLNAYTGAIETKWIIPGGGSPDMGNVSADGTRLWVSGRYNNVVYVFDTKTGAVVQIIPVGDGPHGLALMPLPGRYSLGHTGITR